MTVSDTFWDNHSGDYVEKMPWGSKSLLQNCCNSVVRNESDLNRNDEK